MGEMTEILESDGSDRAKVESWRLHVLMEAGYPLHLAEQLAHVGDAGAQRLETRLNRITSTLERQRDEFVTALEQRFVHVEEELRRRADALTADTDAQRAVLEARLHEVSRRIDDALARAQDRVESLRTS